MCYLFDDFKGWKVYCEEKEMELFEAVVEYEVTQKQRTQETIWNGLTGGLSGDEASRENWFD